MTKEKNAKIHAAFGIKDDPYDVTKPKWKQYREDDEVGTTQGRY